MAEETKGQDNRPVFTVTYNATHGWMLLSGQMVVAGFAERNDAFEWLLSFFDSNARRAMEADERAQDRAAHLKIHQEEMLARLLEPDPTKKPN